MFNTFLKKINITKLTLLFFAFLTPLILCDNVFASDADPTGIITIFCNVIDQITSGVGKVIAILILISMAIGLFLGKITWGLAIAVMVGMGLLFGASGVVDIIAGSAITASGQTNTDNICATVRAKKSTG